MSILSFQEIEGEPLDPASLTTELVRQTLSQASQSWEHLPGRRLRIRSIHTRLSLPPFRHAGVRGVGAHEAPPLTEQLQQ